MWSGSLENSLRISFVFFFSYNRWPWYVMLVQKVLWKQAGSLNLISVTSYCAVWLVKQVKFCKLKSWNTTSMVKKKMFNYCNNISIYYMAESSSGQAEANPAFWLAAIVGKMAPSYPLGKSCVVPTSKSSVFGHVINRRGLFSHYSWILASQKSAWPISSHLDGMLVNNA